MVEGEHDENNLVISVSLFINSTLIFDINSPFKRFGNASSSCVTFSSGEWVNSHSLLRNRETHFSWTSLQGVLLMGSYGDDSTELLSPHGISHENFTMKLPN